MARTGRDDRLVPGEQAGADPRATAAERGPLGVVVVSEHRRAEAGAEGAGATGQHQACRCVLGRVQRLVEGHQPIDVHRVHLAVVEAHQRDAVDAFRGDVHLQMISPSCACFVGSAMLAPVVRRLLSFPRSSDRLHRAARPQAMPRPTAGRARTRSIHASTRGCDGTSTLLHFHPRTHG